jgi:thiamine biosynthesis lipoprotein
VREQETQQEENLGRKNRRDTLVVIALTVVLIVAAVLVAKWLDPGYSKKPYTREEDGLLDDRIVITAYGKNRSQVEKAVDAAFEEIRRVDSIADRYNPDSEISILNAGAAAEPVEVSGELWEMISLGKEAYEASGGLFDITVGPLVDLWDVTGRSARGDPPPSEEEIRQAREKVGGDMLVLDGSRRSVYFSRPGMVVDLGGLAKGYALDRAADALRGGGVQAGVINMVSTIQLIGAKPEKAGGPYWEVVIMNPREGDYLGELRLPADTLISTSGDYQRFFEYEGVRYHHILDPRTGYPAQGAISATMIGGASGAWSDIMSTALFVMGYPEGLIWAEGSGSCELVMVDREGTVHSTPGVEQWAESLAERI